MALAFTAASSKADQALIAELLERHAQEGFTRAWLAARGVGWAADLLPTLALAPAR